MESSGSEVVVRGGAYRAEFQSYPDDLHYMRRTISRPAALAEIAAFGPWWSFFVVDFDRVGLEVQTRDGWTALPARCVLFLPAFTILRWRLASGMWSVDGFFSENLLPVEAREPFYFSPDRLPEIRSREDIVRLLKATGERGRLELETAPSAPARRLKHFIDRNFQESLRLSETFARLGISPAVGTRYFRRNYGMAPVRYRNNLRVTHAMYELLRQGGPVTEVAHAVGFQDKSRFNAQFRRFMKVVPSQFMSRPSQG